MNRERSHFRFMDLEIWQDAVAVGELLFRLADRLEQKRLFRFAEQIRGSGLSISNNIAEGSGSESAREFAQFLNITRRSVFESANAVLMMQRLGHLVDGEATEIVERLDLLSRRILTFRRTLLP